MTPTELGILAMAVPMLALAIHIYLQKRGTRRLRDFRRTLDTVLLPRETVQAVCPQRGGRWILTNKRLLLEKKGGFQAVPLEKIKSAQGVTADGNRTSVPGRMAKFIVKADKEYILKAGRPEFEAFVQALPAEKTASQEEKVINAYIQPIRLYINSILRNIWEEFK